MAQMVQYLTSKYKALNSHPRSTKKNNDDDDDDDGFG